MEKRRSNNTEPTPEEQSRDYDLAQNALTRLTNDLRVLESGAICDPSLADSWLELKEIEGPVKYVAERQKKLKNR